MFIYFYYNICLSDDTTVDADVAARLESYHYQEFISYTVILPIACAATLLNAFSFFVFSRQKFECMEIQYSFKAVSASEVVFGISVIFETVFILTGAERNTSVSLLTFTGVVHTMLQAVLCIRNWHVVLISVSRCEMIYSPLRVRHKRWFTKNCLVTSQAVTHVMSDICGLTNFRRCYCGIIHIVVEAIDRRFKFGLYTKDSHSETCLPFSSYVPFSRKKSLIVSETLRASRNSSDENVSQSVNMVKGRLLSNGYPQPYVEHVAGATTHPRRDSSQFTSYVKIPYVSDVQRRRIQRIARDTGISESVRVIFTTEKPLRCTFRPTRETAKCPSNCVACAMAEKPNMCYVKGAVYQITCPECGDVYIGQTERTIKSRIVEHTKQTCSHVFQHAQSHHAQVTSFTWKILARSQNFHTRMALESLHITQHHSGLMNGCEGNHVLPFIKQQL